jgi:leader peptidase (prepilin peptidase)/N-methyltransferase
MQTTPGFFETLALHPALFVACCVVLGLLIGSFLNVVIHRLPIMMENELRRDYAELIVGESPAPAAAASPETAAPEAAVTPEVAAIPADGSVTAEAPPATAEAPATPEEPAYNLIVPRSACPHCKTKIRAQENIPVVSWLMLGGKCSACGAPISKRYPLIELTTGVLSGFVAWHFGFGFTALAALVFTWFLIALTMIDFDTKFLPDQLTYPLLWCGLLLSLFNPVWAPGADPMTPRASIMGAAAGYLSLWAFYWLYKLVRKEEGMGYGDFKLFSAIGAWLGLQMLLPTLIFASGVGALVGGTAMLLKGKGMRWEIPFGPFLAAAGWLAMMYGHRLVDMYLLHFSVPG